jgi:dolichyl-diphosphooligosaccharide--protein glycosyltransferase
MWYILLPSQSDATQYMPALVNTDKYYLTMVSRLHNFDGSLTEPSTAYYVEYADPIVSGTTTPLMVNAMLLPLKDALIYETAYNLNNKQGYHATIVNSDPTKPTVTIPALKHYRLVHESPTTTISSNNTNVKYVKTFEYVKGAHIKGDGIIEVPILTNTGRLYIYSQESINGEFIVPYSTTDNNYNVKAIGNYKIRGSNQEYSISEESVITGV